MRYTIRAHLTPARLAWLRKLADGPSFRDRSRVGFNCWQLGWTEWEVSTEVPPYMAHRTDLPLRHHTGRERLTDEGRRVLAEHEQALKKEDEHE